MLVAAACGLSGLPLQWGVVLAASLVAALTDLSARKIPNWLTAPVAAAGLAWSVWTNGPAGLADSLAGGAIMMLPTLMLFIFAGGGAGDAKLMGALGAWLGFPNAVAALAGVSAASLVLAVAFSLARRRLTRVACNIGWIVHRAATAAMFGGQASGNDSAPAREDMQAMPYGVAILFGVVLAAVGVSLWHA